MCCWNGTIHLSPMPSFLWNSHTTPTKYRRPKYATSNCPGVLAWIYLAISKRFCRTAFARVVIEHHLLFHPENIDYLQIASFSTASMALPVQPSCRFHIAIAPFWNAHWLQQDPSRLSYNLPIGSRVAIEMVIGSIKVHSLGNACGWWQGRIRIMSRDLHGAAFSMATPVAISGPGKSGALLLFAGCVWQLARMSAWSKLGATSTRSERIMTLFFLSKSVCRKIKRNHKLSAASRCF